MQTSVRDFSFDQKETIKSFFTDAEWDVIDAALNEYQDHFDTDEDSAILDSVGEKLQNVFDNSVDQSSIMNEGNSDDDTFIDINNTGGKY